MSDLPLSDLQKSVACMEARFRRDPQLAALMDAYDVACAKHGRDSEDHASWLRSRGGALMLIHEVAEARP